MRLIADHSSNVLNVSEEFVITPTMLSFPQEERVGNLSFPERFRTSRNDRITIRRAK